MLLMVKIIEESLLGNSNQSGTISLVYIHQDNDYEYISSDVHNALVSHNIIRGEGIRRGEFLNLIINQ